MANYTVTVINDAVGKTSSYKGYTYPGSPKSPKIQTTCSVSHVQDPVNTQIKLEKELDSSSPEGHFTDVTDTAIKEESEIILNMCPDFECFDGIFSERSDNNSNSNKIIDAVCEEEAINFDPPQEEIFSPSVDLTDTQRAKLASSKKSISSTNPAVKLLAELEQDRLRYYEKKLEIEKEKEERSLDLMERGQEIEKMRIEVQREKLNSELTLKEKEVEMKMALEREKMNHDFELKKLELQLKYKTSNCGNI